MIDLHCHILPGMDDGSPDVETSVSMLRRQAGQGTTVVCGTSHYYASQNSMEEFCARRSTALQQLLAGVPDGLPEILPAAEVAYFHGIEEASLEPLCIGQTRTLMLEMPFSDWTDLQAEAVIGLVLDRNYHVVLVHPERFCASSGNRSKLKRLAQLPIGLQVNAGALLHWRTRRLGLELLELAQYPLLGSDCHNLTSRPPNLKEGREVVRKKLGGDFLKQMDEYAEAAARGWE